MEMQHYDNALIHLEQSLELLRNISHDERNDGNVASTLNNVGNCLLEMQRYDAALTHLNQAKYIA